ncbi:hypothetical protein [Agarivorans sp. 1_MG-2023]|uniref:hypothetical protein n=1 Tax=Agarivorans sp. 1_MG-2023 TaxID=3062634 RepID=UPI0026E419FC|nr:hypothetical protein [Agarivorans sp. 1_MG-2023]MDO6764342.1 hypothetical protein [Agarivorans sp. 1_MG-2023]
MTLVDLITGLQLKLIKSKFKKMYRDAQFDMASIDKAVGELAIKRLKMSDLAKHSGTKRIGASVIATELYDSGGHSPILFNFVRSLEKDMSVQCLFTQLSGSKQNAPLRHRQLDDLAIVGGVDYQRMQFLKNANDIFQSVVDGGSNIVFIFTHPHDMLAAAVVALLKKHTDIKVVYYNHADHLPNLAMSQADLVINFREPAIYITQHLRKLHKTTKLPLQSLAKTDTHYLSKVEQQQLRLKLGILKEEEFTLSGFDSHKIFSDDNYEYLYLIKSLLVKRPKLKHLLISNLNSEQIDIVENIFADKPEVRSRFLLQDMMPNFNELFQSCDLFIDSFPQGSALTHIDMMRNRKPTVVKKCVENGLYSFEEYLPANYPYAFETPEEMQKGIEYLLNHPSEALKVVEENYQHYLFYNEFSVVKQIYLDLVNDTENFKSWIVPILKKGTVSIGHLS